MEYFKIGKIAGTHGVSGKMILQHSLHGKSALENTEVIFMEDESPDSLLPWFIRSASAKSTDQTFIELEGISSVEEARKFLKKEVWLKEEDFKRLASSGAAISLLGYMVIENKEPIGEILEVIEQPHQTLCRIEHNRKEAWIPLHENSVIRFDRKKREVHVELPDGLLDVYR